MAQDKPKVLIVDDRPENLYVLDRLLGTLDVEVIRALSGAEALHHALEHDFCVAIVDIQMPEMDGYELVELLRSNESTATLPAIFVSAIYSDEYHHRKGYEAGAVDFMSKPFVPEVLLSKVKVFMDLYRQRKALQEANKTLSALYDAEKQRRALAESLEQIGRVLASSLEMIKVPERILEQLLTVVPYERGSVLLQEGETVRVIAQHDAKSVPENSLKPPSTAASARAEDGAGSNLRTASMVVPRWMSDVFQQLAETRKPMLIDDVTAVPTWHQEESLPLDRSWLGVPLICQDRVIGMISLARREAAMFSREDTLLASAFAGQAAVALENARLYGQLAHFNEQLEQQVHQRTQELENAYQALSRADKIKSDFVAVAAHELRTPLTLVKGYAGLLKTMVNSIPNAGPLVEGILIGESRLHEIVNSLLDISKIDNQALKVHKEPTSLADVMTSVRGEFTAALTDRRLTLSVTGVDSLPIIKADPDLMFKLFSHLVSNAIKYTPDGGSITIRGQVVAGSQVGHGAGEVVEIAVTDTGVGIDPANLDAIFEKFFQTGSVKLHSSSRTNFKGGGPGLGLTIARGIVQAHGGRIWVESPGYDEDKCPGSCFRVLLPVAGAQ